MDIYVMKAGAPALAAARGREAPPKPPGTLLARFGDDVVFALPESERSRQPATARRLEQADPSRLRVVVQKGRLFNQEHPEVPVLLDRGRYLLVDIAPAAAAALAGDHCYAILPPDRPLTVFEERPRRAPREGVPGWESALVAAVDPAAFRAELDALCALPNRHSLGEGFKAMLALAKARLDALALETRIEVIDIKDGATLVGKSANLIAFKGGAGPGPRGLVLVTAHLDSVNKQGRFDTGLPAEGADDNGSGSAGVLQMARVLASHPSLDDIMFILFGGEEQDLFGSRQFVAALPAADRARLRAVVNMDMVGVINQPPQTVLLEGAPVSQHVIDGLAEKAAAHTQLAVRTSLNPFASDHVPFIEAGLAAVLVIEGDDGQNTSIHTPDDTRDKVHEAYAAEILRMNVGYVASLVGRATTA